jgi:hypothetical protein
MDEEIVDAQWTQWTRGEKKMILKARFILFIFVLAVPEVLFVLLPWRTTKNKKSAEQ